MKNLLCLLCTAGHLAAWAATAGPSRPLSLPEARAAVLKNHPRVTVAELRALAARQAVTETRAGLFPWISANTTAASADDANARIAAGGLNNPSVYERAAVGASFTQLVTDFGRTANLLDAAKDRAAAAATNVIATKAQLLLEVDHAYLSALAARAVKAVAAKALDNRTVLLAQVSALASNQLKSDLDVRFAQVSLDEGRLLVSKAEKDWQAAATVLRSLTGERDDIVLELADAPSAGDLSDNPEPFVALALSQRPDLAQLRLAQKAAGDFARAERALHFPTISAFGVAGVVPLHDAHFDHGYAAAGLNLNLPLFAGGLHEARRREAALQASAAQAAVTEAEDNVIRDVRVAWLECRQSRERIGLTRSLADSADAALALARARFEQGLSSIVELNQAELAQTTASIALASAEYDYDARRDLLDYQTGSLR